MLRRLSLIVLLGLSIGLSACGTHSVPKGYVHGDPCTRCGDSWEFYPNETNAAINQAQRMGFDWRTSK